MNQLIGLVNTHVRTAWEIKRQPYKSDLRARSTTLRVAAGIEPAHMRFALQRANETGAKWKQMFRWDELVGLDRAIRSCRQRRTLRSCQHRVFLDFSEVQNKSD